MKNIISKLYEIIKNTNNFIEAEASIQSYMLFSDLLDQVIKKQASGWSVKREDNKTVSFIYVIEDL